MAATGRGADDVIMDTTMTDTAPPPPPPPSQSTAPPRPGRRLTRSRDDRVLGGICGGLAHTYGWDPGLVRVIIAVAAVVTGGAIAVAYGIAWLVVPEEATGVTGVDTFRGRPLHHARENWALPVGVLLVAVGMLGVAHRFAWHPFSQLFWPITLIGGGLAVLLVRHRDPALTDGVAPDSDTGTDTGSDDVTPPTDDTLVTPAVGDAHSDPFTPTTAGTTVTTPTVAETAAFATAEPLTAPQPTVRAYESHGPWPTGEPVVDTPPRPRRERSMLGRLTWSALLLLAGGAALLNATGAVDVDAGFVLTLALVLVGLALVLGAWLGRSRGLIALALLLVLACSVDAALDVPISGGIGERVYRVQDANTVQHNYELGIGHLVVDLRNVTTADRTLHLNAHDAMGQLVIDLPQDAALDIRTRVGAGDAQVLDEPDSNGWRVDQRFHVAGTGPHFVIDARVGFGQILVREGSAS
ncbi:MAG TPA: PspC domain-containing protein [Acidimicrobiia bacterium]|jgi:phage shock protein PspC (stress-responsive transcriptional regulator)